MTQFNPEKDLKWRNRILNCYLCVAIVISITEIVMLFFDDWAGLIFLPIPLYLLRFFVIPSMINFTVLFGAKHLIKKKKIREIDKNRIVGYALTTICLVTQITHYVFGPIFCAGGLAIFMSCAFGDRKLSRRIAIASLVGLGICVIEGALELRKGDHQLYLDAAAALVFYLCSFLTTQMVIQKNESDEAIIHDSWQEQIVLLEETKRDPLTGLYNRKVMFDDIAVKIYNKEYPILLAVFDLDNFKRINDSYGHSKGDEVLIYLAQLLKERQNENRIAYRFGGEEFSMLFLKTPASEALIYLEEIRDTLEKKNFTSNGGGIFHVTISIGVKEYEVDRMTKDELFIAADATMYISKQTGKNKITYR